MPDRIPKSWFRRMMPELVKTYPRETGESGREYGRSLSRIAAGIWRQEKPRGYLYDPDKISAEDANYVHRGPEPFVCGNCVHIIFGGSRTKLDFCQIVHGPHKDGGIRPEAACRFFEKKPMTTTQTLDPQRGRPLGPTEEERMRETRQEARARMAEEQRILGKVQAPYRSITEFQKRYRDPERLPPQDWIHGDYGNGVQAIESVEEPNDHLLEALVSLPSWQFKRLLNKVKEWEDVEIVDEKNRDVRDDLKKAVRIVRRGRTKRATNIFVDME